MADSVAYAMNWLTKHGYAQPQAAAMVGHGVQESGLNPNARATTGRPTAPSSGAARAWPASTTSPATKGQDPAALDTQLGYMDHELHTSERGAGDALFGATNVRDAARAGMAYERPAGYTAANPEAGHGWANRYGKAAELAGVSARGRNADIDARANPGHDPAVRHAGSACGARDRLRGARG
jgi:hypothetical protein